VVHWKEKFVCEAAESERKKDSDRRFALNEIRKATNNAEVMYVEVIANILIKFGNRGKAKKG